MNTEDSYRGWPIELAHRKQKYVLIAGSSNNKDPITFLQSKHLNMMRYSLNVFVHGNRMEGVVETECTGGAGLASSACCLAWSNV